MSWSGRYWAIGPSDPRELNTFIERPAIEARLLYWLASLHAVNGMLYYEVDRWAGEPCPGGTCKSIGRINNTALTDFSPATFCEKTSCANGDGSFTYPGVEGPVGTIRLANIADGIEDWELFNRLGATGSISHADDLITQMISNMTEWTEDAVLLDKLRREAARRVMAGQSRPRQVAV